MCEECGCGHTHQMGEITHFYAKPSVAVVRLDDEMRNGDKIQIKGNSTDFTMTVMGMRNEQEQEIDSANPGELVAFHTPEKIRPGDKLYLIMREISS